MLAVGAPMYTESVLLNEQFFSGYRYIGVFKTSNNLSYPSTVTNRLFREGDMTWAFEPVGTGVRPSWLDMFVTPPPITAAQISVYMSKLDGATVPLQLFATVYDRRGITYAIAAEAVKKIKASVSPREFRTSGGHAAMCFSTIKLSNTWLGPDQFRPSDS
jgi:hypothetical protein